MVSQASINVRVKNDVNASQDMKYSKLIIVPRHFLEQGLRMKND